MALVIAQIPFKELGNLVVTLGLPTVLVLVFVWWSWLRELRLSSRVTNLEQFIDDRLLDIIQKSTESQVSTERQVAELCRSIDEHTAKIGDVVQQMTVLETRLASNPCLLRTERERLLKALEDVK